MFVRGAGNALRLALALQKLEGFDEELIRGALQLCAN
jgi:hypothetical protein